MLYPFELRAPFYKSYTRRTAGRRGARVDENELRRADRPGKPRRASVSGDTATSEFLLTFSRGARFARQTDAISEVQIFRFLFQTEEL